MRRSDPTALRTASASAPTRSHTFAISFMKEMRVASIAFAGDLGPLPPMKIHCGQLVEGALRSALDNDSPVAAPAPAAAAAGNMAPTLASSLHRKAGGTLRIVPLD